jgi:hypothetical protein
LKGSTDYNDDDDEEYITGAEQEEMMMDEEEEENENDHDFGEQQMLEEEFPPEALGSETNDFAGSIENETPPRSTAVKASILSQLNKRQLLNSRLSRPDGDTPRKLLLVDDQQSSQINPINETHYAVEDITKLHRSHIRECSEFGKLESKILVNVTMKMGKGTVDQSTLNQSATSYLKELDEILEEKINSAQEIRSKIRSYFTKNAEYN